MLRIHTVLITTRLSDLELFHATGVVVHLVELPAIQSSVGDLLDSGLIELSSRCDPAINRVFELNDDVTSNFRIPVISPLFDTLFFSVSISFPRHKTH